MPKKLFPVNETIWDAVLQHEGIFTKQDIVDKLRERGVCPHPIAEGTVKTVISNMSGHSIENVSGNYAFVEARYRNKVDYRLRLIMKDIYSLKRGFEEAIESLEERVSGLIMEQLESKKSDPDYK